MDLTPGVLKGMGFEVVSPGNPIEAKFRITEAYSIQGISLKELTPDNFLDVSHRGETFSFAFGNSINGICNSLLNEPFVENEDEWSKDKKVSAPYFLISYKYKRINST